MLSSIEVVGDQVYASDESARNSPEIKTAEEEETGPKTPGDNSTVVAHSEFRVLVADLISKDFNAEGRSEIHRPPTRNIINNEISCCHIPLIQCGGQRLCQSDPYRTFRREVGADSRWRDLNASLGR